MKFAVIESGKVTNVIMLESEAQVTEFPSLTLVKSPEATIGDDFVNGAIVSQIVPPTAAEVLAEEIGRGIIEIDHEAEMARIRYVNVSPLQQQVYDMKVVEAEAYKAAAYPTTAAKLKLYPLLSGEATATGKTTKVVADTIIATKLAWVTIAGKIEGARIAGKALVAAATLAADAVAAKDATIANLQAL